MIKNNIINISRTTKGAFMGAEQQTSEGVVENVEVEQSKAEPTIAELMAKLEAANNYNEKLIVESKDNANKYKSIRDANADREKLELEASENWKERLAVEKKEKLEAIEALSSLQKTTLRKDLDFEVAKMIGNTPLQDGVSINDVIHQVVETGIATTNDDGSGFENLAEAYAKVKESKQFLFNNSKKPMANAVPAGNAPTGKKLTRQELLSNALKGL
jgi:hypothetical protein